MKTYIKTIIMLLTIAVAIVSFYIIFTNTKKENTQKGAFIFREEYIYEL